MVNVFDLDHEGFDGLSSRAAMTISPPGARAACIGDAWRESRARERHAANVVVADEAT